MNKQIYKYLSKYYVRFDSKYRALLDIDRTSDRTSDRTCNAETIRVFRKLWKREHGGLFDLREISAVPEILPYQHANTIYITDTGSNSSAFHKQYIKTLNRLIISNQSDVLRLDLRGCLGGKPQVMVAGLLPLFGQRGTLSYWYRWDNHKSSGSARRHRDVVVRSNHIICHSNNHAVSIGTRKKRYYPRIDVYQDHNTASAAEQLIICLMSLKKHVE